MYEFKFDYNSKYIPEWNKTVLNIVVFDNDNNTTEYTDSYYGKLTEVEISEQLEYMYNMALDNRSDDFKI